MSELMSTSSLSLPVSQTDEPSLIQSTCAYCGVGCGVDIGVADGKATSLIGSADHPANYGRLCVKGSNLLNTIDLTNRLLVPEIAGEQVSWSQATDYVAQQFNDIIKKHGKNAVAFYVSGQLLTEDYYLANKLMKGYIGSGNIDTNSRLCMSSAVSAYKRAFGEDVVPCTYQDLEQTDLLLLTGSNAAWTHPVLYQRIERAKKINPAMKVVVIDPRKTATCEIADSLIQLKPGTDAAFFNGLLNYLNDHDGLDTDYITKFTEGFQQTLKEAKSWSVDAVAEYCQVNSQELVVVYQLFCQSKKAVTFYSMGINQSSSGVDKCQSIINCHLASGKMAKVGCGPFSITGQPNAMGGREVGGLANQLAAHMDIDNPLHQEKVQRFWQSPTIATEQGTKAVEMFDKIATGEIKAVWIMATNPMVSLPDRAKIAAAMKQCQLVVVSDCVEENDTLAFADVKLPATPWLEKNGTVTNSERRISRQRNAAMPAGLAKHDWQIIRDVAQAMDFDGFDFEDVSDVFKEYSQLTSFENNGERLLDLSGLSQLTAQQYQQLAPIQWPVNNEFPQGCARVYADGKFNTDSSKAQFYPVTPQLPIQRTDAEYPFVLNSGRMRDQWHTMTRTGKASKLSAHTDKPYLYLHPSDANKLSVQDDDMLSITASTGQAITHVKVDNKQRAGECFMPIHWNKSFASHGNVSALYQGVVDPISGQAECKQGAVQLTKKSFKQYVSVHRLTSESEVNELKASADFWLKNTTAYGEAYQAAFDEPIVDVMFWCQQTSGLSGEWLTFQQDQQSYIVCLQAGKLCYLAYSSNAWPKIEPSWLEHVFSVSSLEFATVQSLLLGIASEEFNQGKQVCSCFAVGEKTINQAITQGCTSVEKLGEKLQCGTKCGSCKPELASLINQYKTAPIAVITDLAVG
ncbi:nitrate reductase [Colwellia psychrerythraea]|uniref:Nitrate reductase n=1 Tax=Colwellia psychrerythraea TaxID=28229 RepID=A0A099KJL1_COLPS|nr:nitrate reductase [Colwellia psychrerythraea]KGJ91014.1 Nitrate reductase [Colwellia psychrerythraea]